jgi:hypothetical protein
MQGKDKERFLTAIEPLKRELDILGIYNLVSFHILFFIENKECLIAVTPLLL